MGDRGKTLTRLVALATLSRGRGVGDHGSAQRGWAGSAARVRCVLRDAPRLRPVAPHESMFFMALRKMPHPEVPREARPRRTHDILPALRISCPTSARGPRTGSGLGG